MNFKTAHHSFLWILLEDVSPQTTRWYPHRCREVNVLWHALLVFFDFSSPTRPACKDLNRPHNGLICHQSPCGVESEQIVPPHSPGSQQQGLGNPQGHCPKAWPQGFYCSNSLGPLQRHQMQCACQWEYMAPDVFAYLHMNVGTLSMCTCVYTYLQAYDRQIYHTEVGWKEKTNISSMVIGI